MGHIEESHSRLVNNLQEIEQKIGHTFINRDLLIQAFVHKSFLNEWKNTDLQSNERLEFLGDSVLSLFVSNMLFSAFPSLSEGDLSKRKAYLVSRESCAHMGKSLDIATFVLTGKGEQKTFTGHHPSLTSDLFEALIGAVFLDGGWQGATKFLSQFHPFLLPECQKPHQNPKTELQEFLARQGKGLPEYRVEKEEGPSHERLFSVSVSVFGQVVATASGRTKQQAELHAAEAALEWLHKEWR